MAQQIFIRRDTSSWFFQVWVSFAAAVLLCGYGVLNLPLEGINRIFLAMGFCFTLFASFALSKSIRDNQDEKVDTSLWRMQVWFAFGISLALLIWGLSMMKVDPAHLGYMLASGLFLISATFTLAKTIRDNHDADVMMQNADVHQAREQ
ncbi:MAG: hypothetical protein HYZ45_10230 [Burkholderiales bacterium]|nr:hypothetical protein [Burkholderiales bacterium]